MTKINVFFDGKEYINFKNASANHNIDRNIAVKEIRLNGITTVPFKDFIVDLNFKKRMLARVFINDKLYLEGFINQKSLAYRDSAGNGTEIDVVVNDRFSALKFSDIIKTKPQGSLQTFTANILKELGYATSEFVNTYNRPIKIEADLLKNGIGVDSQKLKSFTRRDIVEKDCASMLGEALSLSKVFLISNGYDTLTFETPNSVTTPSFLLIRNSVGQCNIAHAEKSNDTQGAQTPSRIILLNSSVMRDEETNKKIQDKNTSVVVLYDSGLPHIQKVNHLSVDASYQSLQQAMNFSLAGIRARANSFLFKSPNQIFDINGDFLLPNRMVKVLDEKYGIDENMQILQSGFTIDANSGTELILNVTTQEAFNNNASIKQKKSLMRK